VGAALPKLFDVDDFVQVVQGLGRTRFGSYKV
jgi:hypothetical protein